MVRVILIAPNLICIGLADLAAAAGLIPLHWKGPRSVRLPADPPNQMHMGLSAGRIDGTGQINQNNGYGFAPVSIGFLELWDGVVFQLTLLYDSQQAQGSLSHCLCIHEGVYVCLSVCVCMYIDVHLYVCVCVCIRGCIESSSFLHQHRVVT